MDPGEVKLVELNRHNWEQCAFLEPEESQKTYLPSNLYSLAQAHFEKCFPYGITWREEMAGLVMYATFGGIYWINRIMVAKEYQHLGIASEALELMVGHLRRKIDCRKIKTSVSNQNETGLHLFKRAGFRETGKDEFEIMLELEVRE